MCIAAIFKIAKMWNQSKCPLIDEYIMKIWYIIILKMEYYSAFKRKEILVHTVTLMNTEDSK